MKVKLTIISLFILGAILGLVACFLTLEPSSDKQFEVTYTVNGGVPYAWEFEIEDPETVEFVKEYISEDKNKNGLVGAPISTNYVFKGLKAGITAITFRYVSLAENTIVKEEVLNIKVDKDLNMSLIALVEDE